MKTIIKLLLFLPVVILFGCSTPSVKDKVLSDYDALVLSPLSQITGEQARLIAQKELVGRYLDHEFDLESPKLVQGPEGVPGLDKYWYVKFDEIKRTIDRYIFIVIIEKTGGRVRFCDDYPEDKEWILESAVYGIQKPSDVYK